MRQTRYHLTAFATLVAVVGLFIFARSVFAVSLDMPTTFADFSQRDVKEIIQNIVRIVLGLIGTIFTVIILYAGWLWMTSRGEKDQILRAKKMIVAAVIGLVVTLSSYAIARFIIDSYFGASSGSTTSSSGPGTVGFGFALGAGSLESHYPGRNAINIPRNTNIFVTFKEPIEPADMCNSSNKINTANIQIWDVANIARDNAQQTDQSDWLQDGVTVNDDSILENVGCTTNDNLTFRLDPNGLLGSDTDNALHSVTLKTGIHKFGSTDSAFPNSNYSWNFTVATFADVTPPSVTSVFPVQNWSGPRNVIVQINFSEPVDPTTASGIYNAGIGFSNITLDVVAQAPAPAARIEGAYISGNQYTTTEFIGVDACGINSCGQTIYCLPGPVGTNLDRQIDGVVTSNIEDMAGNKLDQDPATPVSDPKSWSFKTTGQIDLTGPAMITRNPINAKTDVSLRDPIIARFNEPLSAVSVRSNTAGLIFSGPNDPALVNYWVSSKNFDTVPSTPGPEETEVTIDHDRFKPRMLYHPHMSSGLSDMYQNCYLPSGCYPDANSDGQLTILDCVAPTF